jgi:hypothetical protein
MNIIDNIDQLIFEQEKTNINKIPIQLKNVPKENKTISKSKEKLIGAKINISKVEKTITKHLKRIKITKSTDIKTGSEKIKETYKNIMLELFNEGIIKNIGKGILLALIVIIINQITTELIFDLFDDRSTAYLIGAIIIGPLIEEIFKFLSIKWKSTAGHFAAFNVMELVVTVFVNHVGLIYRILPIIMHGTTTMFQKFFYDNEITIDKNKIKSFGLLVGLIIHMVFNGIPYLFSSSYEIRSIARHTEKGIEMINDEILREINQTINNVYDLIP